MFNVLGGRILRTNGFVSGSAFALGLLFFGSACGQGQNDAPTTLPKKEAAPGARYEVLHPGQLVRVTSTKEKQGARKLGTILGVSDGGLWIQLDRKAKGFDTGQARTERSVEYLFADIDVIEIGIDRGSYVGPGLLLGAVGGAVIGGFLGSASNSTPEPNPIHLDGVATLGGIMLGGLLGLAVGGGIGAGISRVNWVRLPQESYRFTTNGTPRMPLRIGVAFGY